ncbi:MAG: hypothetical protein ABI595_12380 [Actinomycetota bacterium]
MLNKTIRAIAGLGLAVVLGVATWPGGVAVAGGCPIDLPQGGEPVTLDPADFTGPIDNPYWPMTPGTTWKFRETDKGVELSVRVYVTTRTKEIIGIQATVVHDVVREGRHVIENTWDWYAQDACGNVWYLGENTKEYENGAVVSTAGSWEAGVDGAQPGVVIPADPAVGVSYRQEFFAGEAEDHAEILSVSEQAEVPFGHFTDVLLTKDDTPLHPKVLEYKLYARGVGPVLVFGVSGGSGTEELISFELGAA